LSLYNIFLPLFSKSSSCLFKFTTDLCIATCIPYDNHTSILLIFHFFASKYVTWYSCLIIAALIFPCQFSNRAQINVFFLSFFRQIYRAMMSHDILDCCQLISRILFSRLCAEFMCNVMCSRLLIGIIGADFVIRYISYFEVKVHCNNWIESFHI